MSNLLGRTPSRDEGRALPKGETIGRYSSYLDAQKAVDYLADQQFPVENVSIIGNDLKTVERVTGRLSYPRVAMSSAATGAWFGFFVGLILMLFGGQTSYLSVVSSMALGAVFWLLFGVLAYAFQRGKRDFTSTSQVIATSYDVIVAPEVSGEARRLLAQLPMSGAVGPGAQPPYQPPYQQQPWQDPHQQPNAPARPAGWEDPYGGQGAVPGAPQGAGQPEGQQQAAPPRGTFPDLPDGRPQYGVRLPAESPAPPPAEETPRQDQES
jgi:hypothetical protein